MQNKTNTHKILFVQHLVWNFQLCEFSCRFPVLCCHFVFKGEAKVWHRCAHAAAAGEWHLPAVGPASAGPGEAVMVTACSGTPVTGLGCRSTLGALSWASSSWVSCERRERRSATQSTGRRAVRLTCTLCYLHRQPGFSGCTKSSSACQSCHSRDSHSFLPRQHPALTGNQAEEEMSQTERCLLDAVRDWREALLQYSSCFLLVVTTAFASSCTIMI